MPENQEELQQKFVLYQMLNQRLEEIKSHLDQVQQRMIELETTNQAVEDMSSIKKESEVLIPLGSGLYTYGKSSSVEKILVDIGAGVMVKKDVNDAKKKIEDNKKEVEHALESMQKEATAIVNKMNELGEELQKAVAEHKHDGGG